VGCSEGISDWSREGAGVCICLFASDETYSISTLLKEAKGLAFPLQSNIRTQKTDKYV